MSCPRSPPGALQCFIENYFMPKTTFVRDTKSGVWVAEHNVYLGTPLLEEGKSWKEGNEGSGGSGRLGEKLVVHPANVFSSLRAASPAACCITSCRHAI